MYSLSKIIDIMLWRGGWIDIKRHKLLKDFCGIENNVVLHVTRDQDWNIVSVDYSSPDYIRIPNIGAGRSSQYFIQKNNISDELLEEYGILGYADKEYPLFVDDGKSACFPAEEEYFSRQVVHLSGDIGIDLPYISEYAMDDVLKWCSDNGIEIINDYHPG